MAQLGISHETQEVLKNNWMGLHWNFWQRLRFFDPSLSDKYDQIEELADDTLELDYDKSCELQLSAMNLELAEEGTGLAAITAYGAYLPTAGVTPLSPAAFMAKL